MGNNDRDMAMAICEQTCADMGTDGGADLRPECMKSSDCPNDRPICESNACRACTGTSDDTECKNHNATTPRCDGQTHACVACLPANAMQSPDCTTTAPVCGTDSACRKCQAQSECASLVCNVDGSCAPTTDVVYVDNQNGTCTGTHTGTLGDRICEIQTAVMTGGKPIVRVFGSSTAYARLNITSGTITVVGPTSGTSAKVSGDSTNPAINLTGASTALTLDGLEVTGGGLGQHGIACTNGSLGPTVNVYRSNLHGLGGAGLNATMCKVTLDRDLITNNSGGGISLSGSQYSITNCFIVANVSTNAAVSFGPSSSPIPGSAGFAHNTVAGNGGVGTLGGISCNAGAAVSIANSIVYGNSKTAAGATQLGGNCALTNVDIDDGTLPTGTGNRNLPPDFISTMPASPDYHLTGRTANNLACCIDQITASPVDHDYDGSTRPINIKWDIGAHEVP